MRKLLAPLTVMLLVAALCGCGHKRPDITAAPAGTPGQPGTAAAPGQPGTPAQPDATGQPGAAAQMSPAEMKAAFEKARTDFPGTFAVMGAVRSIRNIEGDKKGSTLSAAQAKGLLPILKDLSTRPTLPQADATKIAGDIGGYLTPEQNQMIEAQKAARMSGGKGGGKGGPGGPGGGMGGPGGGMGGGMGGAGGGKGGPGGGGGKGGGGGRGMDWLKTMTPDKNIYLEGRNKDQLAELIKTVEAKAK
jgi:hypothetical protein